jgi:hypothetical protein
MNLSKVLEMPVEKPEMFLNYTVTDILKDQIKIPLKKLQKSLRPLPIDTQKFLSKTPHEKLCQLCGLFCIFFFLGGGGVFFKPNREIQKIVYNKLLR